MPEQTPSTANRSTAEILRAARARIEDPKHWTQCEMARNSAYAAVPANDPTACQWCTEGAVAAEMDVDSVSLCDGVWKFVRETSHELFRSAAFIVNDTRTHADVLDLFDASIARAEGRSDA